MLMITLLGIVLIIPSHNYPAGRRGRIQTHHFPFLSAYSIQLERTLFRSRLFIDNSVWPEYTVRQRIILCCTLKL